MDLRKMLKAQDDEYQLTVARAVVNYTRAPVDTQAKMLDSYKAIIQEYDDEEYYNQEQEIKNQGINIDEYLDDPRHGQSSKGEH
jgi:hypothetical protein